MRRIHVRNFRCLQNVVLELTPLTIIVGPNGSGKTTLLRALGAVIPASPSEKWQHNGSLMVERHFTFRGQSRVLHNNTSAPWRAQHLELRPHELRKPNLLAHANELSVSGANLTNVIESLGRKRQGELAERLCALIPLFQDLDVLPLKNGNGHKRIVFRDRWKPDVLYEPSDVSDGTMLVLALLTLGFSEDPPDVLSIESPEGYLHPYLLGEVVQLLRSLADGKLGPAPMTVVVATHSPTLLEFAQPREVRFVWRDPSSGATQIQSVSKSTPDFEQAMAAYDDSLGSLWLSGGLGGIPATTSHE